MRTSFLIVHAVTVILCTSCKKESDSRKSPETAPTGPPVHKNLFYAKIDGKGWTASENNIISGEYFNRLPKRYTFAGGSTSLNENTIYFEFPYLIGQVTFGTNSKGFASYADSGRALFFGESGSMHISKLDTNHKKHNKFNTLMATFSFVTNPVNGVTHTITNGYIDYQYKGE